MKVCLKIEFILINNIVINIDEVYRTMWKNGHW
jgi:hypothetical protein